MYCTIQDVRNRKELSVSDTSTYDDDVITYFIERTQRIVDSYMGQTLELVNDIQERVVATPNMVGGVHIQLSRRFIVNVDSVKIIYGYDIDDEVLDTDQYQVNKELGYIETTYGAKYPTMFNEQDIQHYIAEVQYDAGLSTIPDDFMEAFYAVMVSVIDNYKSSVLGKVKQSTGAVKSYRTLNESVTLADDGMQVSVNNVITGWVEETLRKYAMPKFGLATRI